MVTVKMDNHTCQNVRRHCSTEVKFVCENLFCPKLKDSVNDKEKWQILAFKELEPANV